MKSMIKKSICIMLLVIGAVLASQIAVIGSTEPTLASPAPPAPFCPPGAEM